MAVREAIELDVLLDIIGEVRMNKIQQVAETTDAIRKEVLRAELKVITEEEKIMQGARSFPNVEIVRQSVADKIRNQYAPMLKRQYERL